MAWLILLTVIGFLLLVLTAMHRSRRGDGIDALRDDLRRRLELEYGIRKQARAIRMSRAEYVDVETDRLIRSVEQQIRTLALATGVIAAIALPLLLTVLALQLGSTQSPLWGLAMVSPLGLALAYMLYTFVARDAGMRAGRLEAQIRRRLGRE